VIPKEHQDIHIAADAISAARESE
jgi:hypothetical protein